MNEKQIEVWQRLLRNHGMSLKSKDIPKIKNKENLKKYLKQSPKNIVFFSYVIHFTSNVALADFHNADSQINDSITSENYSVTKKVFTGEWYKG